jgi:hypothetical protein
VVHPSRRPTRPGLVHYLAPSIGRFDQQQDCDGGCFQFLKSIRYPSQAGCGSLEDHVPSHVYMLEKRSSLREILSEPFSLPCCPPREEEHDRSAVQRRISKNLFLFNAAGFRGAIDRAFLSGKIFGGLNFTSLDPVWKFLNFEVSRSSRNGSSSLCR